MSLQISFPNILFPKELESIHHTSSASYLPQWLFLTEAEKKMSNLCMQAETAIDEPLQENTWGFSCWSKVIELYQSVKALYEAIKERHADIHNAKQIYRPLIQENRELAELAESMEGKDGAYLIDSSLLAPISEGISGSYVLLDPSGTIRFVVKPLDEDIGCLNNRKGFATPFKDSPIRDAMPLYRSSLREALAFQAACAIGAEQIAPKTVLAIIESNRFFDLSDQISGGERKRYFEYCGLPEKEKLCSVQEYIPESKTLFEALHELQALHLSDEEIANRFDTRDFEDANILIWTTYDTDAHGGNILVYPKGSDEIGNERLGLKKIDNGLAFPDENRSLRNSLAHLPNAKCPLSQEGKEKIAAIDIEALAEKMQTYGLESAAGALRERIGLLKTLAALPGITLKEINHRMSRL